MRHAQYIGRVGALAVALGVGAAVATHPGIALAQDAESEPSNTGTAVAADPAALGVETPSEPTGTEPSGEPGPVGSPPDMNVAATTIDTSTHDDDPVDGVVVDDEEGEEPDVPEAEAPAEPTVVATKNDSAPESAPTRDPVTPQEVKEQPTQPVATAIEPGVEETGLVTARTVTETEFPPSKVEVDSFALQAPATAAQNPIAALVTLPLRIVGDVLSGFIGGGPGAPGENPLLLGVLAWARRQIETFTRTFSNEAPVITGAQVDENADGTFTITVDTEGDDAQATDPDGDTLTLSVTGGLEGTIEKTGANTFRYTPGEDFDGDDVITLTASDQGGLFGFNRKTATVEITVEAGGDDPTQPEDPQPPTQQDDGTVEQTLNFDPTMVTDVTIAPGFEPKYYTYEESYNEETGEYELTLTPTQAGMLRAALGLDTADSVGLQVTTAQAPQTIQTLSLRSASFAATAAAPDYVVNLPDIPAGEFVTGTPIVTSPGADDPAASYPAGVVVTDRYAYVVNSNVNSGGDVTVAVIGADPDKADYLQVVDEIPIGGSALLAGLAKDRLYIADGTGQLIVIDTDGADPTDEADDNALLSPVDVGHVNGVVPIISPDETTIYLINQQLGTVEVIDVDPDNTATYHTVVDSIGVTKAPTIVDNGDGTITISAQFPLSGAFNADGTRLYLVRDTQTFVQNGTTGARTDFVFTGEIVTINTSTNEIVGEPLSLGEKYGYFASSDGRYLYVPTLDLNGFDPTVIGGDISPILGSVTVIDLQEADHPAVVSEIPTGNLPVNVAFSPDKSLAYVVDAGRGTVWVIDTVNQQVLDLDEAAGVQGLVFDADPTATLGQVFNVVASSPDGTQLFVTNFSKGTVVPLEFVRDEV